MKKILVLGSNGALGTSICKTLKKKNFFVLHNQDLKEISIFVILKIN